MTFTLQERAAALQATKDHFDGHAFAWGRWDCARLLADYFERLGAPWPLDRIGPYSSATGAVRFLQRLGFESMGDVMASRLSPIPPAFAWLGDIIEFESEHVTGCLGIALGNNSVYCYVPDCDEPRSARIIEPKRAWRVSREALEGGNG